MKRAIFFITLTLLLTSLASAEMLFKEQPNELYSLGDLIKVPMKIATSIGINDFLSIRLLCNGIETEINKQYITLIAGEEQDINVAIPLTPTFMGRNYGTCTVKALLGDQYLLSKEFKISNNIIITLKENQKEVAPGEHVIIEGTAVKENGQNVQGFVEVQIMNDKGITSSDTVKEGYFMLNISLPKNIKAGQCLVNIRVYEKDGAGNASNQGATSYNIRVTQVPTTLEILLENNIPGENLGITSILHDQSGEKMDANSILTLKNEKGKILEQVDLKTGEYLEYPIAYNQPPLEWTVSAKSGELSIEESFNITEKEIADIEIINKTIIITNKGNVPYNETVVIKIGNQTLDFETYLGVDGVKKYELSAPAGEYQVEIRAMDEKTVRTVMLTGNVIKVEEIGSGIFGVMKFPFVWIFMIIVLGFAFLILFKKGYRQTFIGYMSKYGKGRKAEEALPLEVIKNVNSMIAPKNPAMLSLSMRGEEQDVSMICLKIKNEKEVEKNKLAKEILQKITDLAESHKATTYQNQNNIMFMLVPVLTKTFKNQKKVMEIAQESKNMLDRYNKVAKEKIDYGLSVNYGTIVAKKEKDGIVFMSMGPLITEARKLSAISVGEIYISRKMHEKTMADIKVQKHEKDGQTYYTLFEIKEKSDETKKFIYNFVAKQERENKEAESKKQF